MDGNSTAQPTRNPTTNPTNVPTQNPASDPTNDPTITRNPTINPTEQPTAIPTSQPTKIPTITDNTRTTIAQTDEPIELYIPVNDVIEVCCRSYDFYDDHKCYRINNQRYCNGYNWCYSDYETCHHPYNVKYCSNKHNCCGPDAYCTKSVKGVCRRKYYGPRYSVTT